MSRLRDYKLLYSDVCLHQFVNISPNINVNQRSTFNIQKLPIFFWDLLLREVKLADIYNLRYLYHVIGQTGHALASSIHSSPPLAVKPTAL
jgi:hypothetical protein